MYPRNAASPERIAIGAVILIADGTVQSSGVAVTVRGQGGTEAGSAGTIAYGASGIVYYTPTQGETDFTSFILIASKSGCIPVAVTIVTTASATPGYAGLDWGVIANKTTANALTNTSIATVTNLTNLPAITANWLTATGIAAAALNGKGDWNTVVPPSAAAISTQVGTDLTASHGSGSWITASGFSTHTAADVWAVSTRLLTAGTNIVLAKGTGVTGFNDIAATAIVSSGAITTSGGKVALTSADQDAIVDKVWDEVLSGHLTSGTTGAGLNAAGSAGDPWGTTLPGAYGAGTAGKIIGDNLNGTVASRASQASVNSLPTSADLTNAISVLSAHGDSTWITATGFATSGSLAALVTTVGAAGAGLTATASAVWAVGTRILTAGTNIVLAKGTGLTGLNDIAATAIVSSGAITTAGGKVELTSADQDVLVDKAWNELLSGHVTAGSAGAGLAAAGSAGDPWSTPLPGAYGSGTAGNIIGSGGSGGNPGPGTVPCTYTVTNSVTGSPIAGVTVWVGSDSAGTGLLASGVTGVDGKVTFLLDPGTAYFFRQKAGFTFTNPDIETVVAP